MTSAINASLSPLLIVLSILGMIFIAIVAVYLFLRLRQGTKARTKVLAFSKKVRLFRERYDILRHHAANYSNFIANCDNSVLDEINFIFQQLERKKLAAISLLQEKNCLNKVITLLAQPIPPFKRSALLIPPSSDWNTRLDRLLNALALHIYTASISVSESGEPSKRVRGETMVSLRKAGIDLEQLRAELKKHKEEMTDSATSTR